MFQTDLPYTASVSCEIVPIGKRRDGSTRFWCLSHQADATEKYGVRAEKCRYAAVPPILETETITIDLAKYSGGVAVWGAVPPIFDTTRKLLDMGIHVHARELANGDKVIDRTFRKVVLKENNKLVELNELDAIYYMVSTIFDFPVKRILCSRCDYPHLDKDWFSVHPHKSHLCARCGRNFSDHERAIGNPIGTFGYDLGYGSPKIRPSTKKLKIKQKDFPAGIQIWGSNPAIISTSPVHQESGIHLHAFSNDSACPALDETYGELEIDGVKLNEHHVRTFMAQRALPHLSGRVQSISCDDCGEQHFDSGTEAFTPREKHCCTGCWSILKRKGRQKGDC